MKRRRLAIVIVVPIVIVLVIVSNLIRSPSAVEVEGFCVEKGEIESAVSAPGRIRPYVEVKLSSDIMGRIVELRVKEGEQVDVGQIVALLDSRDQEARVRKAVSTLNSASASLRFKESEYSTAQELFKKELISNEEYQAIKTEYEIASTQVEQARATLEEARQELQKTKIITPISGIVTELNVEEGEIAVVGTMNNPGTVLMIVSDLGRVVAVCEVDESDVIDIETGYSAKISIDAFPDTSFEGEVIEVSSSGTTYRAGTPEEVTNFEVKIELKERVEGLKPNMSTTCRITTEHRSDALKIPIQSLMTKEEGEGVFLVRAGIAEWTDVGSGISDEKWVEIEEGLGEGDTVVSGSYKALNRLKSGDRVEVSSFPEKEEAESDEKGEGSGGPVGDDEAGEEDESN
jgi:HlyD family secretion protein